MKKIKTYGEYVKEMATVGRFDKNAKDVKPNGLYTIRIYSEPLGNPTFHLEKINQFEIVLQIKNLKIVETKWVGKEPNKQDFKTIIDWFIKTNDKFNVTNWEFMKTLWNNENPKFEIDYKMPKYKV